MVRKLTGLMIAAAMVALVLTSTNAADEKGKTIKQVMKAANGKKGVAAKIAAAAKAGKWDAATASSKDLEALAKALSANTPPKGDAESWKTHTEKYSETAAAFLAACEKKDLAGVQAAGKSFGGACGACHKAHKGAKK